MTQKQYTLDPYSARVFILKMEEEFDLSIRVHDNDKYCMICIDKVEKKEVDNDSLQSSETG